MSKQTLWVAVLVSTLLLCAGCKDLFHSEEPEKDNPSGPYTVTFNADGGSPATQTRQVDNGSSVGSAMPSDPVKGDDAFGGWYTARNGLGTQFLDTTVVTGNITVYAKWNLSVPKNLSLNEALAWINSRAVENGYYIITLKGDENISPQSLGDNYGYYYNNRQISITLIGETAERMVNLSATGSLFTVNSGFTLTLDNNVTLLGRDDNTNPLVTVNSGGALIMKPGSKITGNTTSYYSYGIYGSGVYVGSNGTFTLDGGEISGNTAYSGVVYLDSDGIFTMSGGEISDNSGTGVYINDNGTFGMSGGEISGNSGYGVTLNSKGTFTMSGGEISGNSNDGVSNDGIFTMNAGKISGNSGRGVELFNNGTFTMNGGEISGNSASGYGEEGVRVIHYGSFTMNGGKIADNSGRGVSFNSTGTFTMNGGEISGNTSSGYNAHGGGVYVAGNGTFVKQPEAVIYGADADESLRNMAVPDNPGFDYNYGHAVYVDTTPAKIRNTTSGTGITLDSSLDGAAGGWVDPEITAFSIGSITGAFDGVNIIVVIPYSNSSEISNLTPSITVPSGATVSPASGVAQNFSEAVQYTVTTEDGSSLTYNAMVKNSRTRLITFDFSEPAATGSIDEEAKTVDVIVPYATNPGALVSTITLSPKATVSPASGVAQNFSSPVDYTVTAEDGSTEVYTVTVTPKGQGSVVLVYPEDAASGSLIPAGITLAKPGGYQFLQAGGDFDSYRWRVDGVIRSNEKEFILLAVTYSIGNHQISLEVVRDGVVYAKSGAFKVQ
jgi:uncharacterized repeat protein (TIGR02543 family)